MTEYNVAVKYKPKLAIKTIIITFIILVMLIKIISMTNLELFNNVKNKAMLIINPIDIESVSTVDDSWQLMLINSQNPMYDIFRMLIFDGTFYHLWYIPAAIAGVLIVCFLSKKLSLNNIIEPDAKTQSLIDCEMQSR